MSISTYFNATIRNTGIKEFCRCIDRLLGRHLLIQDKNMDLHDPLNCYFSEHPKDCMIKSWDNLAYGIYHMIDPLSGEINFDITISKDKSDKPGYADGDKIEIFDFIDKSYDKNTDFTLLLKTCEMMGFCKYTITDEWTQKTITGSFDDASKVYFREIRNSNLTMLEKDISRILLEENISMIQTSVTKEIDDLYDEIVKNRQNNPNDNPFRDTDYEYLADRAIVKGFVLSGLNKDDFIEKMNTPYKVYRPEYLNKIISRYEEEKEILDEKEKEVKYE